MVKIVFDDMIINNDIDLKTEGMVDLTIKNMGVADIQFSKQVIKTDEDYGMSSGLPLANKTINIQFIGTGTKKAYIAFGRIQYPKCGCK